MVDDNLPLSDDDAKKAKDRARRAAWRAANKERISEYNKAYAAANKDRILANARVRQAAKPKKERAKTDPAILKEREKARRRAHYIANKDRYAERWAKYYTANRDELKERCRVRNAADYQSAPKKWNERASKWRKANIDTVLAQKAGYRAANPEVARIGGAKRRARKRAAPGTHSRDDIAAILIRQRRRCAYCRCKLDRTFHVDHIKPLALGGSNDRRNLQMLCAPCNQSKGAKDPVSYAKGLGLLL